MPSNLSHCLVAVAACGVINIILGLPSLSSDIFFAGLLAMLINLDYSRKTKLKRTPWGHSPHSAVMWSMIFLVPVFIIYFTGAMQWNSVLELSVGFSVAYWTHLILDFFTTEGLYVFRRGRWSIINSSFVRVQPKDEGNALLNVYISIPSAIAIMVLVGLAG